MKAEFNEKERMSELGAGMLATIALLLFLAVLGVFKFYIVLRMSNDINFSNTPEMDSLILQQKVVTLLQAILLFVGALALYYSKSRWSVFGVIALMIFVMHVALLDLVKLLFTFDFSAFHLLSLLDIAVFAWIVGYLLLSPKAEQLYTTGTRVLLTRGLANTWQRIRGRPSIDEIEAARLDQTFN